MSAEPQIRNHAAFIWSVADKRLQAVRESLKGRVENVGPVLEAITGIRGVYNGTSPHGRAGRS